MIRILLAALALILPVSVQAEENLPPATVVVAFDRETITPLIIEGVRNRESGEPVEANDPVRIASISKLIMGLAALRLEQEGVVNLDADILDYLDFDVTAPGYPQTAITLAQLLSHSAALTDRAGYIIPLGESLEAKLADPEVWNSAAPPGEAEFEYANLGSPLVATVLEAAAGERYDRILERTVFEPLGVRACINWIDCPVGMTERAVTLYRNTGEVARDGPGELPPNCTIPVGDDVECALTDYVPGTNASIFSPQGGVRIGMLDLAKIGQALLAPDESKFFNRQSIDRLNRTGMRVRTAGQEFFCNYGLALQAIQSVTNCNDTLFDDGIMYHGHAGEAYGLRSGLWLSTRKGRGFAYFTTQVPPRQSEDDEGGFDPREIALMKRAQTLLVKQQGD